MLVGLTGFARSGKDTVGSMLSKELGCNTYALASPIKHYVNYIFGWDERCDNGVLKEEIIYTRSITGEDLETKLTLFKNFLENRVPYKIPSTEAFHKDGNSLWDEFVRLFSPYECGYGDTFQWCISPRKAYQLFGTEFARDNITQTIWTDIAPKENVIWTDVRFEDEAKALLKAGGKLVRIIRPDQDTIQEDSHSSEAGIKDAEIFATLVNDGTMSELRVAVIKLVNMLKEV